MSSVRQSIGKMNTVLEWSIWEFSFGMKFFFFSFFLFFSFFSIFFFGPCFPQYSRYLEWSIGILEWSGVLSGVFQKVAGMSEWPLYSGVSATTPAIAEH